MYFHCGDNLHPGPVPFSSHKPRKNIAKLASYWVIERFARYYSRSGTRSILSGKVGFEGGFDEEVVGYGKEKNLSFLTGCSRHFFFYARIVEVNRSIFRTCFFFKNFIFFFRRNYVSGDSLGNGSFLVMRIRVSKNGRRWDGNFVETKNSSFFSSFKGIISLYY